MCKLGSVGRDSKVQWSLEAQDDFCWRCRGGFLWGIKHAEVTIATGKRVPGGKEELHLLRLSETNTSWDGREQNPRIATIKNYLGSTTLCLNKTA